MLMHGLAAVTPRGAGAARQVPVGRSAQRAPSGGTDSRAMTTADLPHSYPLQRGVCVRQQVCVCARARVCHTRAHACRHALARVRECVCACVCV
jgi:hypothetical protein